MTCSLTPTGREGVRWWVDRVASGGFRPNPRHLEDEYGFVMIGEGNHRVVFAESNSVAEPLFDDPDCVVKLSKGGDPWANQNEIINWEYAPSEIRGLLAPIHEYGDEGYWLTMPRAEIGVEGHEKRSIYNAIVGEGYDLDDVRADNMGYIDGNPRIVDYGFRIERRLSPEEAEERGYGWGRVGPESRAFFGE